jgi:hypothetical protein
LVCPCKFPLLISREGIDFIALPLDTFNEGDSIDVPEIVDDGEWVVVKWIDKEPKSMVKTYEVAGHIVRAGCREDQLKCSNKSIYSVAHPKKDWEEYHIVDVD